MTILKRVLTASLIAAALVAWQPGAGQQPAWARGPSKEFSRSLATAEQLYGRGAFHEAVGFYQQASTMEPENFQARLGLGRSLARVGEDARALKELFSAMLLNPSRPRELVPARVDIAAILMKQGNYDEAGGQLKQLLDIDPSDLAVRGNLGICLEQIGYLDAAIEQFKYVIRAAPDSVPALYNLGNAFLTRGDFELAGACFEKITRVDPSNALALVGMARTALGQSKLELASRIASKAVAMDSRNHLAYLTLAESYDKLGVRGKAIENYKKAIQLNPKDPASQAALARLLESSRKVAGAGMTLKTTR